MPTADELAALAREMEDAQDHAHSLEPFTARSDDFDLPAAYAVAELIHRERLRRGAVPVGRKIGFTNPAMWALYGVDEPIWGYVYDTTVVHVDGGCADCRLGGFTEPKIEPEIVLHFGRTPPADGGAAEILAAVDWIAHGIEIVQSHFPGWKFGAADTVADGALHATLLVGTPQPTARLGPGLAAALERFSVSLFRGETLCETGRGANVLGSPLRAIAHLLAVLRQQPEYPALQAGELVTTGTLTPAQAIAVGERWRTELHGIALPGLEVTFVH